MAKTFLQITDGLAVWKFFPTGKDRASLAMKIAEWCCDIPERGEYLLTCVDDFDEYPGPATLRKLIKDKFQPGGALAPYAGVNPEFLPPIECSLCNDTGTVMVNGKYAWCSCKSAKETRQEMPKWLETMNRFQSTPESKLRQDQRARAAETRLKAMGFE